LFFVACGLFPLTMLLRREPTVIAEQSGISVLSGWRAVSLRAVERLSRVSPATAGPVSGGIRQHFVRVWLSGSAAALPGISRAQRRQPANRYSKPCFCRLKAEELAAELKRAA